jgi:hypothetical protein
MNFDEIYAPEHARRAVEVALAGEHSIMFIGRWQSAGDELVQYIKQQDEYATAHFATLCPCGFWGSETHECTCSLEMVGQWQADHFGEHNSHDIYLELYDEPVDVIMDFLAGRRKPEPEEKVLERIQNMSRYRDLSMTEDVEVLLRAAVKHYTMPARTAKRVLRVARTIANLAHSETIRMTHMAEAIQYRSQKWIA